MAPDLQFEAVEKSIERVRPKDLPTLIRPRSLDFAHRVVAVHDQTRNRVLIAVNPLNGHLQTMGRFFPEYYDGERERPTQKNCKFYGAHLGLRRRALLLAGHSGTFTDSIPERIAAGIAHELNLHLCGLWNDRHGSADWPEEIDWDHYGYLFCEIGSPTVFPVEFEE